MLEKVPVLLLEMVICMLEMDHVCIFHARNGTAFAARNGNCMLEMAHICICHARNGTGFVARNGNFMLEMVVDLKLDTENACSKWTGYFCCMLEMVLHGMVIHQMVVIFNWGT